MAKKPNACPESEIISGIYPAQIKKTHTPERERNNNDDDNGSSNNERFENTNIAVAFSMFVKMQMIKKRSHERKIE